MEKRVIGMLILTGALLCAVSSRAGTDLGASWSDGLTLQSADKNFKIKIGGRIMNDWAWFDQEDTNAAFFGNIPDGTEFRRARLGVSGTVHQYVLFKAEFEFAGASKAQGEVALKDVYMGLTGIPLLGTIQAGHQKEPLGLETLMSSNAHTFMEKGQTSVLQPERNTGLRMINAFAGERLTFSAGIFRDTDDGGRQSGDGTYAGTVRLTMLPWADEENIFHIGGAYSRRNPARTVEYATRPDAHLAPELISTENIISEAVNIMGAEAALSTGGFRAQSEYTASYLESRRAGDPSFQAFYVYLSALLTGERYGYKRSEGLFEPVKPESAFDPTGSAGALELGVRYDYIDLADQAIAAGKLSDVTVGLNWYLAPTARIMLNYVYASVKDVDLEGSDQGSLGAFQIRFHVFF